MRIEEAIVTLYEEEKLSIRDVADKLDIGTTKVRNILMRKDALRSPSEAQRLRHNEEYDEDFDYKELLAKKLVHEWWVPLRVAREVLDVSMGSIQRWCGHVDKRVFQAWHYSPLYENGKNRREDVKEATWLYHQKFLTYEQVGEELGVSEHTARRYVDVYKQNWFWKVGDKHKKGLLKNHPDIARKITAYKHNE